MNWLQRNSYVGILFVATLFIVGYFLITDNGNTTYKDIEIQHGDTLWTLAEQYRGNMEKIDWIEKVKAENNLNNEHIVAGKALTIPVSADQVYFASDDEESDEIKVAVKE